MSKAISAPELEEIINTAPLDGRYSEEFDELVFEKTTMEKIVYWVVIIVFSQVSSKDMLAALIANANKEDWALTDLVNETDLAMATFQFVGNMAKWERQFKNKDDVEEEDDVVEEGDVAEERANAPGKFCRTKDKSQFDSGFTEEGMDFYHRSVAFFEAIQESKSYFVLESNITALWNDHPLWRSKKKEAEAAINKTARKAKPVVHEEDVPEVCPELGKMIYGDDYSDFEDDALDEDDDVRYRTDERSDASHLHDRDESGDESGGDSESSED